MLFIEIEKLVIRRINKSDYKLFNIHYIEGEPVNDVNIDFMKTHRDTEIKPSKKLQSSVSMLVNN